MFKKVQADFKNEPSCAQVSGMRHTGHFPSIPQQAFEICFLLLFLLTLVSVILYDYILLVLIQT